EKHGKGLSDNPRHLWRLRETCEKAKIFLSTPSGLQTKVVLHGVLGGEDFEETLNRSKFNQLNMDLFEKTLEHVKSVLQDAN
ncbi:Hsp70 family protein, partial [Xanthomonas citri pv. citri]|nr:Hsp70 family protein [Xanthomonas citri pv. citri]